MPKLSELGVKQQMMVIAVVGVLILIIFSFLLRPKVSQLSQISASQQQEEQRFKTMNTTLLHLQDVKKQMDEITSRLDEINKMIPEEADMPSLIIEIQEIANEANIEFEAIRPKAVATNEGYSELPLEIRVNGYFYDLVDFLYRLENLTRVIKVNRIQIAEGALKLPNITTTIMADAYILTKPNANAAAAVSKNQ